MFRHHRNDPHPTNADNLRDRFDALAAADREASVRDGRSVRGRLAASASLGLRSRLAQPSLSTPRG